MTKLEHYNDPKPCEQCGQPSNRFLGGVPGVIFAGEGWISKDLRVARQMAAKNRRLAAKEDEKKRDGGVPRLAPNVGGERVDSWADAQKLAKDLGKDSSTYDSMVRAEKSAS